MSVFDGISQAAHLLSLAKMGKLVSDYTISYPQRFIILTWIIGISRESIRIWESTLKILSCFSSEAGCIRRLMVKILIFNNEHITVFSRNIVILKGGFLSTITPDT
jgi:hypothetical protein